MTARESPISTLIVDDEPLGRRRLRQLLDGREEFAVVAECRNGHEAVDAIARLRPALVFLDVQMPDLDGIGVVEQVGADAMPAVIFVTAHDKYAVRAFEVSALDYVLKPIAAARFERVLARVVERLTAAPAAYWRRLERLLDERPAVPAGAHAVTTNGRILIPGAKRDIVVRDDELEWVSADGCYATLHATGRAHLLRESLNALEIRLDPARFVRTHRSAIVNIEWVRELHRTSDGGGTVVLASGAKAPVSRRRLEQVAARLNGASARR